MNERGQSLYAREGRQGEVGGREEAGEGGRLERSGDKMSRFQISTNSAYPGFITNYSLVCTYLLRHP